MESPTGKLALAGSECFFEPSRSNFCISPPGFCLILGLCWATTIFFCSNLEWKMDHLAAWHMNNDLRPCHIRWRYTHWAKFRQQVDMMSCDIPWYPMTSCDVQWDHIMSCYITWSPGTCQTRLRCRWLQLLMVWTGLGPSANVPWLIQTGN